MKVGWSRKSERASRIAWRERTLSADDCPRRKVTRYPNVALLAHPDRGSSFLPDRASCGQSGGIRQQRLLQLLAGRALRPIRTEPLFACVLDRGTYPIRRRAGFLTRRSFILFPYRCYLHPTGLAAALSCLCVWAVLSQVMIVSSVGLLLISQPVTLAKRFLLPLLAGILFFVPRSSASQRAIERGIATDHRLHRLPMGEREMVPGKSAFAVPGSQAQSWRRRYPGTIAIPAVTPQVDDLGSSRRPWACSSPDCSKTPVDLRILGCRKHEVVTDLRVQPHGVGPRRACMQA